MAPRPRTRLPAGQAVADGWPVFHVGSVPPFDASTWDLRIGGLVDRALRIGWEEFGALERRRLVADFHCVVGWSRLDEAWEGVSLRTIAERVGARPEARFVRVTDGGIYDATVPFGAAGADDPLLATRRAGAPLAAEEGAPVRLVVPRRWAWKSVKWVRTIDFLAEDRLGFWEVRGYPNAADPWRGDREP